MTQAIPAQFPHIQVAESHVEAPDTISTFLGKERVNQVVIWGITVSIGQALVTEFLVRQQGKPETRLTENKTLSGCMWV